jgi:hypothetical protein
VVEKLDGSSWGVFVQLQGKESPAAMEHIDV